MLPFIEQLHTPPPSVEALQKTIQALDACFVNGFVGIQNETLAALPRLFAGTPLQAHLTESIQGITENAFVETHFLALAAARSAMQGALYDLLVRHAQTALGRADVKPLPTHDIPPSGTPQPDPLLDSVRHWLMEIAISGFARLEVEAVQSFSATLAQVRANPATAEQGALLTGFWHEVLEALPIKDTADVPLTRWCDLWSLLMIKCVGIATTPTASLMASGTLYPLGVELRTHARAATLVVYGVLSHEDGDHFVRVSWNAFKVAAIRGDEIWLLFPDAQPLLEGLAQGKGLVVTNMPLLSSGDLLWSADSVQTGKKYKGRDIAQACFAVGKNSIAPLPMPALERHPIHIAEPIYVNDYRVEEGALHWGDGAALNLDSRRASVSSEAFAGTNGLFGLLHYDDGQWSLQALYADDGGKVSAYVGDTGAAILKKPPKTSTVSVLRERAGRLLRKKTKTNEPIETAE